MVRTALAGLALALLGACAAAPEGPEVAADANYHLLIAEIALERGEFRTVVEEYASAARLSDRPEVAIRATELAFSLGYDALALDNGMRWLELNPDNPTAHLVLARLHLRRSAVEASAHHAARALDRGMPPRAEDYRLLAAELGQDGNARQLTRVLARLAAVDPLSGTLQLVLGQAALRAGDWELADYAARQAALDDPDWPEPQQLIAQAMIGMGLVEEGLAHSAALVESQPDRLLELEHARLLGATGRIAEARTILDRLAAGPGAQPEATRLAAFFHLQQGNLVEAWELFSELLNEGYSETESFYYLGQIAEEQGSPEQAQRLYAQIEGGPFLLPARLAIAGIHQSRGELDLALAALDVLASEQPHLAVQVHEFRAALFSDEGDLEAALAEYDQALVFRPEAARLHLNRGILLATHGEVREAIASLRAAYAIDPDDAAIQNALGYTLADANRNLREAARLVRLAFEQVPDSAAIIDSMGWVRFRQRRFVESLDFLEDAWARQRDPEVAAHLGEVRWRMGDRAGAHEIWDQALAEWPDSRPLLDTVRRLRR
ncbi:MAG: tetratricopeptide repeat protein [Chromatiales bacterium]|nr:tetratricopeptide repeat protein [Chromatiales bacterium]